MGNHFDNLIRKGSTPSVQYIHFDGSTVIQHQCLGFAKIRESEPVNASHVYHGFSVTKTFTALAVMQLAAKGSLQLDAPASSYLTEFPYGDDITIRHLLNHTAGIPSPIPISWIHLRGEHGEFSSKEFFQKVFAKHPKTKFLPGTKFEYSNTGYVLLGWIIEAVSGVSFEAYIQKQILEKLSLLPGELGFAMPEPSLMARGYHKRYSITGMLLGFLMDKNKFMSAPEGSWKPFRDFYVNGSPYGGLFGTAQGFMKYIQALLRNDGSLLPPDAMKQLFTENHTTAGKPTGMCLSWFKGAVRGHTYYCHAGGGGGYYSEIRLYPESSKGSVVFLNRSGMTDERLLDALDGGLDYV